MLDTVSDTLGDLAGALGDAEAGPACEGDPSFARGEDIGPSTTGEPHAHAMQTQMVADERPVQFVHFGMTHMDDGTRFEHPLIDDTKPEVIPEGMDPRALMYRAAMLRETLLLHGFVASTRDVLNEYNASKGTAGEIMDAAAGLLAGGGEGTEPPDPAELERMLADIRLAGGGSALEDIQYEAIHTTGSALHQARADHVKFCLEHLEPFYVAKDGGGGGGGGGLMGTVGDVVGPLPGVGDVMEIVTGIIFKAFDLYVAMYLCARDGMERSLNAASYDLTLRQIRDGYTPVFDAWFPRPPVPVDDTDGGDGGGGGGSPLDDITKPITDAIDTVESEIDSAKQSFREFFGEEPEPTFGDASMTMAVGTLEDAAAEYIRAFRTVIGVDDLPDFVKRLLTEFVKLNAESLRRILMAIHQGSGRKPIVNEALYELGRQSMYHRILKILADLVPFLGMLSDPDAKLINLNGVGGLGASDLVNKGLSELDTSIGPPLNNIVELAMAQLGDALRGIQAEGVRDHGVTMEIYLGRTPYLLTLMMRNTLFPVWELLVQHVFGNITGALGGVMSTMDSILGAPSSFLSDAQSEVDDVNDTITNVTDNIPTSVDQDDIANFASDPEGAIDDFLSGDDPLAEDGPPPPPPDFPGSPRTVTGRGVAITSSENDQVEWLPVTEERSTALPDEDVDADAGGPASSDSAS